MLWLYLCFDIVLSNTWIMSYYQLIRKIHFDGFDVYVCGFLCEHIYIYTKIYICIKMYVLT